MSSCTHTHTHTHIIIIILSNAELYSAGYITFCVHKHTMHGWNRNKTLVGGSAN